MTIVDRITAVVRRHVPVVRHIDRLDPDADLKSVGLDSLTIAGVLVDLENEFGVSFPVDRITPEAFRSLHSIAASIQALLDATSESS